MTHRTVARAALLAVLLLAACDSSRGTSQESTESPSGPAMTTSSDAPSELPASEAAGAAAPTGSVQIAVSVPSADGGWLGAVADNARKAAAQHDDVELILPEGTTNADLQIRQVQQLLRQAPDALVILPHDDQALTPVALQAMAQGIPVITVERPLSEPRAYRTFVGGDNYGIGVSAGNFFAEQLGCKGNVVEIRGLAGISVTSDRSRGFRDAITQCGGGIKIVASQPADFSPQKGLNVMQAILKNRPDIDAVYSHDDVMAEGVAAAIQNAGRAGEMFLTGVGGSANAMDAIAEGGLLRATFLYNPSMATSAVNLARLIALGEGLDELAEPDVPGAIVLSAATVTADNVAEYRNLGY